MIFVLVLQRRLNINGIQFAEVVSQDPWKGGWDHFKVQKTVFPATFWQTRRDSGYLARILATLVNLLWWVNDFVNEEDLAWPINERNTVASVSFHSRVPVS